MAGKAAQTSREMPAMISFLRPVASIAAATLGSSQALTVDRSMILMPGRASTSSGKVPHAVSGGGGYDDRQLQRFRCLRQRDHIVLQLARRIIADACHEADLVVDENDSGIFRC